MARIDLATGDVLDAAPAALVIATDADEAALAAAVESAAGQAVAIRFPEFKDGRGFGLARRLRERHGFTGPLVATGRLIPDLAIFLARSGFDYADIPETGRPQDWTRALTAISGRYQAALRGRRSVRPGEAAELVVRSRADDRIRA